MLETHNVPATSVVKWDCSWGNSFASPKSAILASSLPSNRMLLALMSLCIIRGWSSSWRYASPRAVPMAMLKRVGQSISMASFGPPVLPKYTFYLEKKFFCTSWVCQITYPDMNLVVMWCLQLSLPLQFSPWCYPHKITYENVVMLKRMYCKLRPLFYNVFSQATCVCHMNPHVPICSHLLMVGKLWAVGLEPSHLTSSISTIWCNPFRSTKRHADFIKNLWHNCFSMNHTPE